MEEIKQGNFSLLDEAHHFLAGYKSLFTDWTFQGIEEARIACGGAGFLAWSGFPELHDFYSPQQTFEGDNTVMMQQSSRYLFKLIKKAAKGKKLEFPFEYIAEIDTTLKRICPCMKFEDFFNLENLNEALKVKTSYIV